MIEDIEIGDTRVTWDDRELVLTADGLERRWRLTPQGLKTTFVRGRQTWIDMAGDDVAGCDWSVFAIADGRAPATLQQMDVRQVAGQPFVGRDHLEAVAVFRYPYLDSHFDLRWRMRAYPGTAGVRTQIALRAGRAFDKEEAPTFLCGSFAEQLPVSTAGTKRLAAGYYNDTQHRNFDHTPILKEQTERGPFDRREIYDWANLLLIERGADGIALVKESHKCVNQAGFDTGAFVVTPDAVGVSGLGYDEINNSYLPSEKYRSTEQFVDAWATWLIAYDAEHAGSGATAVKRFDRAVRAAG